MPRVTDPLNNEINYTYDKKGNIVNIADKNGNATEQSFDKISQLIEIVNPMSDITPFQTIKNSNNST